MAEKATNKVTDSIGVSRVPEGPKVDDFGSPIWQRADAVLIERYWSGELAPAGRHAVARMLWSETGIHVLFDAGVAEPLVISDSPDLTQKTIGLWDRDVCEIFIAPNAERRGEYFEFEVAPTGEWLDVKIESTANERLSDWSYASGMRCAGKIDECRVLMAMAIPWSAFGKTPSTGDVWLGNLLRCAGKDPDRGYLAWRPTRTELPNFHVPDAFGAFVFAD